MFLSLPYGVDNVWSFFMGWWNDHDAGTRPWSNISFGVATISKTAAYTALFSDHLLLMDTTSAAFTLTLPTAVGIKGKQFVVINIGTKILTIATTAAQTINGGASLSLPGPYFKSELYSDGSNWLVI